jgi:hypothetical protein
MLRFYATTYGKTLSLAVPIPPLKNGFEAGILKKNEVKIERTRAADNRRAKDGCPLIGQDHRPTEWFKSLQKTPTLKLRLTTNDNHRLQLLRGRRRKTAQSHFVLTLSNVVSIEYQCTKPNDQ